MIVGRLQWGRILWTTRGYVAWFSLVAFAGVATHLVIHHPEYWGLDPGLSSRMERWTAWYEEGVPFSAIGALGSALAIFLAFRNNSAYDRWWEARKIWGALVNDSRSWCRQCVAWVRVERGEGAADVLAFRKELVHRHLAFVHGLALHLRKDAGLVDAIEGFLPPDEADYYRTVPNVPTALLIRQGVRVAELRAAGVIEHFRHLAMDGMLTRLSDIQGKCERIKNTPLPRQYDQITRAFVVVYGSLLPFGLAASVGWAAIPLTVVIAMLFVLLEGSGRVIENPFENTPMDTPMTALSLTIERDLRAALEEPLPEGAVPVNGVLY